MRGYQVSFGGALTPAVKLLIILNVSVYLLTLSVQAIAPGFPITFYGGLVPYLITHKLFLWQFITYMFFHGGVMHLLINMLVLWMFGGEIERLFGTKIFYRYYFICGIGAGIFNYLVNIIFGLPGFVPIIGASGAIYGLLAAYGIFFGDRLVFFMMLFPIRAKYFVIILGGIEFFSSLSATQDGIAHLAHLGGMVFGLAYIYLRIIKRPPRFLKRVKDWNTRKKFKVVVSDISEDDWNK